MLTNLLTNATHRDDARRDEREAASQAEGQAEDLGQTLLYLASLPPRACVNELIISPTWNRFYVGGLEKS